MKRLILSAGIVLIGFLGYSSATEINNTAGDNHAFLLLESVKQNYLASLRLEALKTGNTVPGRDQINSPANFWMKRVKAGEVNMVTNHYTKDPQTQVIMGGKIYYTSGESYTWTMQQNPSIRFAKDPVTNKTIDKAEAVIYIDASGRALYFESGDTYERFVGLAEQETVYGYTPPKDLR
ncbi:MAG: hypothetical protein HZA18_08180 [Nitrospirae bacterium]|nr:hypothetical protein [Nitrospirota bacterium]